MGQAATNGRLRQEMGGVVAFGVDVADRAKSYGYEPSMLEEAGTGAKVSCGRVAVSITVCRRVRMWTRYHKLTTNTRSGQTSCESRSVRVIAKITYKCAYQIRNNRREAGGEACLDIGYGCVITNWFDE